MYQEDSNVHDLAIPSHTLSTSGKELYRFINTQTSTEYLCFLANYLYNNGGWNLAFSQFSTFEEIPMSTTSWTKVNPANDEKK